MPAFPLPPLNALRVFEAAARLGSFKAAAEELHVTPSAVSHQVANLEAVLGVTLFQRDGRALALGDAGAAYQRRIHEALALLSEATAAVTGDAAQPALAVLAAPSFADKWLMPRLDAFLARHPELRVRVEATADRRRLGDADVGILYGPPAEPGVAARPLIAERMRVLCSPALLAKGPPLARPEDLAGHVLIQARNRLVWRAWLAARGLADLAVKREMRVDRSTMAIEAAQQGLGVILESDFLAADEIADGRLVDPLADDVPPPAEDAYFLVTRGTVAADAPAGLFIRWLEGEVAGAA